MHALATAAADLAGDHVADARPEHDVPEMDFRVRRPVARLNDRVAQLGDVLQGDAQTNVEQHFVGQFAVDLVLDGVQQLQVEHFRFDADGVLQFGQHEHDEDGRSVGAVADVRIIRVHAIRVRVVLRVFQCFCLHRSDEHNLPPDERQAIGIGWPLFSENGILAIFRRKVVSVLKIQINVRYHEQYIQFMKNIQK